MNPLDELFLKYGTDKSSKHHNFAEVYHPALAPLRPSTRTVLEIGIFGITPDNAGASLKAWADYFPNATIYGVDLNDYTFLNCHNIKTIIADQAIVPDNLARVANLVGDNIDLIIDDGGHHMHQQQISLGYLFKLLRPGGCYIIEDLQTSYFDICNPTHTAYNTMLMLEVFKHTGIIQSEHIPEAERLYLQEHIASCDIHRIVPFASETALIWKRGQRD